MTDVLVRTSESLGSIAEALTKAQTDFGDITKNRTANAGSYSYTYADLTDILAAIRKPLADNGLAVMQPIAWDSQPFLVTRLVHTSGEWIESVYPLQSYDKPQDMGSAITYARRYALTSLLSIAADDDDAQAAQKAPKTAAKKAPAKPKASGQSGASEEGQPSAEPDPHRRLRNLWIQKAEDATFTHSDMLSWLEAKWQAKSTADLAPEKLNEDIQVFELLKEMGAERVIGVKQALAKNDGSFEIELNELAKTGTDG